jgi:hypothetical protein
MQKNRVAQRAARLCSAVGLYALKPLRSRRDAFNKLAARDALMVDSEPQTLGIELTNRYHAVKRAAPI